MINNVILDFADCKKISDIHEALKDAFSLPEYYGDSLEELFECLADWGGISSEVQIHNFNCLPEHLGEYGDKLSEVFDRFHAMYPEVIFIMRS